MTLKYPKCPECGSPDIARQDGICYACGWLAPPEGDLEFDEADDSDVGR